MISKIREFFTFLIASLPSSRISFGINALPSLARIKRISSEERKKVDASIINPDSTPHFSTITPPRPKPSTAAIIEVTETREFAKNNSSLSTREGIIAILAGIKNLPAQKERKTKI